VKAEDLKTNIDRNFTDAAFNINAMSYELGGCYTTIYECFSDAMGMTPSRYLENKRLEHALNLLQKNDYTICGICYAAGYSHARTFRLAFKRRFSKTPKQVQAELTHEHGDDVMDHYLKLLWG